MTQREKERMNGWIDAITQTLNKIENVTPIKTALYINQQGAAQRRNTGSILLLMDSDEIDGLLTWDVGVEKSIHNGIRDYI